MLRLLAIAFIWLGCTLAWVILGGTLVSRTGDTSSSLDREVQLLWGPPGQQLPPTGTYADTETTREVVTTNTNPANPTQQVVENKKIVARPLLLDGSTIEASFDLRHRSKGLLWFPTYTIDFSGAYLFVNPTTETKEATLRFPLNGAGSEQESMGSSSVSFDDFQVLDEAGRPVSYSIEGGAAVWKAAFAPEARHRYTIAYHTRGTSRWQYAMSQGTGEVKSFSLHMKTSFPNVDFPPGTTSPTEHHRVGGGWEGHYQYLSLVSGGPIGIQMPELLNPGPLASKVTFFAPVSLLFFFFVVAILATVQRRSLHPMHYLLLGCAFFAFHLLFSYLVDHVAILPSFVISSLVSVVLVVSYARLFVGWRFALREMGLSQVIYLVLFSYTFFWKGMTGLSVTIGAIVTLFIVMQMTGRLDWNEAFRKKTDACAPGLPGAQGPASAVAG
jgi:hypothetical protein